MSYYPRGYYIIDKRVICKYYDYLYYILTDKGEWRADGYAMTAYYDAAYDIEEVSEGLVYNRIGQLKLKTLKDEKIALRNKKLMLYYPYLNNIFENSKGNILILLRKIEMNADIEAYGSRQLKDFQKARLIAFFGKTGIDNIEIYDREQIGKDKKIVINLSWKVHSFINCFYLLLLNFAADLDLTSDEWSGKTVLKIKAPISCKLRMRTVKKMLGKLYSDWLIIK